MKALVGMHRPESALAMAELLEDYGYHVVSTPDVEDILAHICASSNIPPVDLIIMDVNLGLLENLNVEPAIRVGGAMGPWAGKYKFYCVSGNAETVDRALEYGLPCYLDTELPSKLEKDLQNL